VLKQLIHNGVLVPEPPELPGLYIIARGLRIELTPEQEEMALAWAAKKDTPYVQDPVFVRNFMQDLSRALGIEPPLALEEVDFSAYYAVVDERRRQREALSPEGRKAQAAERKRKAEELKARYGYAIVDGERVELATYMVEPSGIFMGRGQHPLRGRWKQGASRSDITLNYGPDEPHLGEGWKEIVWQPESMWVARWEDKLTGKLKYVWLSDTAPVKQDREAGKFDQALELEAKLDDVRQRIDEGLQDSDPRRRMVAMACYLIDRLCLRVGDEKEADEADTVGATTLRPEHVTLHEDGSAEFDFLGKDSVHWHKQLQLDARAYDCLAELIQDARPSRSASGENGNGAAMLPQLFPDIGSQNVNAFFSSILPGLSAKKFRTYHATKAVESSLRKARVKARDPEYVKWHAANMANLAAAELCNHTKQVRGSWEEARARYEQRMAAARQRIRAYERQASELEARYAELQAEAEQAVLSADEARRASVQARFSKRLDIARQRIEQTDQRRRRAVDALGKIKAQMDIAQRKREWNLSTSLKSYVDPRVYHRWGQRVDYDVLNSFYPTMLRRKYAWIQHLDAQDASDDLIIRPCLPGDMDAVARLLRDLSGEQVGADTLRDRFLPELGEAWRVALVMLREDEEPVAFAALGPVYTVDGLPIVDCFAAIHPQFRESSAVERLGAELMRQYERFVLLHPVKRGQPSYRLATQDSTWYEWAPGLPKRLGLSDQMASPEASPEAAASDRR